MSNKDGKQKKEKKPLNSILILLILTVVIAVLTWLIPAGSYERIEEAGRQVVDPSTFQFIEGSPTSIFDLFRALPYGMSNASLLIVAFMITGGAIEVLQRTGAINVGIARVIQKVGVNRGDIILVLMFYLFAAMGAFLGFVEGAIPFMPIAIAVSVGLGYDSMVGVGISLVGAVSGFISGATSPTNVGLAQTIAGLELFSGIGMRLIIFVVVPAIALIYILMYARRVKKNPARSLVAGMDTSEFSFDLGELKDKPFTVGHAVSLLALAGALVLFVIGSMNWGWAFLEMAALFFIVTIVGGIAGGLSADEIINTFTKGVSGMVSSCLVLGISYGIAWLLSEASVLDTIVYYISQPLASLPAQVSVIGIFVAIMFINLFIPSASGKAAIVMPIVLPIADIMGITAQTAVLAYQFGDGITNMCTPLMGVLMLALSMGKIPFSKWERFILPLIAVLTVIACIFLFGAVQIGYQ